MSLVTWLSTLLLIGLLVLCGGLILRLLLLAPYGASRVEEIRQLRQAGVAVNQEEDV
ncbi:MAG: hypothetical protein AB7N91_06795 [Candidatus Tectimicrobiota bacterium]